MATELVIQIPVKPSPAVHEAVDRIAKLLDCSKRELAGSLDDLASESAVKQAEISTCAWLVEGFLSHQLSLRASKSADPATSSMEAFLAQAVNRGVQRISIAPASIADNRLTYAKAMNQASAWLRSVMRMFERFGVDLCLRPAEGAFLTSPIELREFIARINSPAIGVDLSTQLPAGLAGWPDWFGTLGPFVRSVRMEIDAALEDGQVDAKLGEVRKVIEALCQQRPFDGAITVRAATRG